MSSLRYRIQIKHHCALILGALVFTACAPETKPSSPVIEAETESTVFAKPDAPYLLAFHSCDSAVLDCGDPRNHSVHIAESDNLYDWELTDIPIVQGSVPDLALIKGELWLYAFHWLQRYDLLTNQWTAPDEVAILNDLEEEWHADPAPYPSENGLSLVYLRTQLNGDPARCADGENSCMKQFRWAQQADDSGLIFDRSELLMTVELSGNQQVAADPDLFDGPDGQYLYISRGQSVQAFHRSSADQTFSMLDEPFESMITRGIGGVPAGHFSPTHDSFFTFVASQIDSSGQSVLKMAEHSTMLELKEQDLVSLNLETYFSETTTLSSPGLLTVEEWD